MNYELDFASKVSALEVRVGALEKKLDSMDSKLEQLLHLRSAGQGAFWLASAIFGTGIVGSILAFLKFIRPHDIVT